MTHLESRTQGRSRKSASRDSQLPFQSILPAASFRPAAGRSRPSSRFGGIPAAYRIFRHSSRADDMRMEDGSGRVVWLWGPLASGGRAGSWYSSLTRPTGLTPRPWNRGKRRRARSLPGLSPGIARRDPDVGRRQRRLPAASSLRSPGTRRLRTRPGRRPMARCGGLPAMGDVRVAAVVPAAGRSFGTLLGERRDRMGPTDRRVRSGGAGRPVLVGSGGGRRPLDTSSTGPPPPESRHCTCTLRARGPTFYATCPSNRASLMSASRSRVLAMS